MRCLVAMMRTPGGAERPYPDFPYAPGEAYPELAGAGVGPQNPVFAAVRRCINLAGLDSAHFGSPSWNPLGDLIEPGQKVLIKPNWVHHYDGGAGALSALVTHTAVLRPVLAYVLAALRGSGRVILGDAPIQSADFDVLMRQAEVPRLIERMAGGRVTIEIRDLRENVCEFDGRGRVRGHVKRRGDPDGYATVDMGGRSHLAAVDAMTDRFRVTGYDPAAMREHHAPGRHEYLIARSVLTADAVINVPKLKTHRKAGLTCCLKNVVGINGSKEYLPHHRVGPATGGGDEYQWPSAWKSAAARIVDHLESAPRGRLRGPARLALRVCGRMARLVARDTYSEGSWYGNDTIWRTAMDLNYILEYARPDGSLADAPQRRVFNVVDAVVAGGGEGPLRPTPVHAAMVLAGAATAAVDLFAARLAGIDPMKVPLVRAAVDRIRAAEAHARAAEAHARQEEAGGLDMRLLSDEDGGREFAPEDVWPRVCLAQPSGWAGHVELGACHADDGASGRVRRGSGGSHDSGAATAETFEE